MWTYLAILFSFLLLVAVFVHRVMSNRRKVVDQKAQAEAKTALASEESEEEKKIRLSREEKEQVEALCKRGEALINSGKDEEAIKCFVQALSINSQHQETNQRLALLYLQK
ncbi:MAG: tetratricopeptide repeat protein, partial [Candidatus Gracilibacteria bacterium]